ncbi:FAD/NAD(P)-binding domain-containing protein [Thozetella sp. PMI_491]|nr:FAD/NAD(P)-binding domain-containing protein [Thozetella sp. PMI_491]
MEEPPTIAILGAGIAGLALAIGLIKRGVPCTIYEACEKFSAVGAGIGLGPNSLTAIDLIDPSFRAKYDNAKTANERPEFKHSVFDALYAEEGVGEKRGWSRGLVGAPYFERSSAHRKDLLEIMESFIPPGTVKFSKKFVEVKQVGDKVQIQFEDGEVVTVDAVIGADGIRGVTRKTVLGNIAPDLVEPKYLATYIYRGILPMADAKAILGEHGGDAKWFMAKGRGVAIYPISKGAEENFVFFIKDKSDTWPHANGSNIECTKEEMLKDLEGFDHRLLKLLDWAKPLRWPIFYHPTTPIFYNGRICMIGDVAHASSPHQAAGAGQGLEDAVVLAHLLALAKSPKELDAAFQVYDEIRRPRAMKVVSTSAEAGILYNFEDPEIGDDLEKIVDNANGRLHWIWQHDLAADQKKAEEEFLALVHRNGSGNGSAGDGNGATSAPIQTQSTLVAA